MSTSPPTAAAAVKGPADSPPPRCIVASSREGGCARIGRVTGSLSIMTGTVGTLRIRPARLRLRDFRGPTRCRGRGARGAGPHNMDRPPKTMTLITSDCGATRSLRVKWPESPRVVRPSDGRPGARWPLDQGEQQHRPPPWLLLQLPAVLASPPRDGQAVAACGCCTYSHK